MIPPGIPSVNVQTSIARLVPRLIMGLENPATANICLVSEMTGNPAAMKDICRPGLVLRLKNLTRYVRMTAPIMTDVSVVPIL